MGRGVCQEVFSMDMNIHKLVIKPGSAKLLCGEGVIAYYPISNTAMSAEVGKDHYRVTVGSKGITCPKCKEKMKDGEIE